MRSRAQLISAIAAAFLLQAALCPALCFARNVAAPAALQKHAGATAKAPCHETSDAPSNDAPRDPCDGKCGRLEAAALADSGTRTILELPAAAFALARITPAAPVEAIYAAEREPVRGPPPRNLLLVKNSFLI